ncbi:hypothetical protein [Peribacillus simplex]|uniref:hypothetical protein n=1 Tax=Peribacillus simplex TaxID=1478 RepID=UPI003D289CFA
MEETKAIKESPTDRESGYKWGAEFSNSAPFVYKLRFQMNSEPFSHYFQYAMNGFSWIHGTVLLILAGLYPLYNR